MNFLSLAGAAPTEISAHELYSFTPNAVSSTSTAPAFSITGKPAWATFDPATGTLSGRPTIADVGVYRGISIQATDGQNRAELAPFDLSVVVRGSQSVTVQWQPPTTNEDGSPLKNLAGYEIRYGQKPGSYTHAVRVRDPRAANYVVQGLAPGNYYFTIMAQNNADVGSALASEMGIVVR